MLCLRGHAAARSGATSECDTEGGDLGDAAAPETVQSSFSSSLRDTELMQ